MKFNPTALAIFLCSAQQAMLRSTVASFNVAKVIARKNHHGITPLASAARMVTAGLRCGPSSWVSGGFGINQIDQCPSSVLGNRRNQAWMSTRGGSTALNSAVATESETAAPTEIFRTDYKPLPHVVSKINMDFVIRDGKTTVTSELFIEPNTKAEGVNLEDDLVLDGDDSCVKLLSLSIDGKDLEEGTDYELASQKLIIKSPKPGAVLKTVVEIVPEENTQLSGLYKSGPMYCSQVRHC